MSDNSNDNTVQQLKKYLAQLGKINQNMAESLEKQCSRIIDNFRKLLMKPGTILVKIVDTAILQEGDIIIYQPEEQSPYMLGSYKRSEQSGNKDIFKFIDESSFDFDSPYYNKATAMKSRPQHFEKESDLVLVKINNNDLKKLELSHQDENGDKYAPIILDYENHFRIGKYFNDTPVSPELSENDAYFDTSVTNLVKGYVSPELLENKAYIDSSAINLVKGYYTLINAKENTVYNAVFKIETS